MAPPAGGNATRLRAALHAMQRAAALQHARVLRPRRLVHHLHDPLLLLQRLPGQPLHVLWAQVSVSTHSSNQQ